MFNGVQQQHRTVTPRVLKRNCCNIHKIWIDMHVDFQFSIRTDANGPFKGRNEVKKKTKIKAVQWYDTWVNDGREMQCGYYSNGTKSLTHSISRSLFFPSPTFHWIGFEKKRSKLVECIIHTTRQCIIAYMDFSLFVKSLCGFIPSFQFNFNFTFSVNEICF